VRTTDRPQPLLVQAVYTEWEVQEVADAEDHKLPGTVIFIGNVNMIDS